MWHEVVQSLYLTASAVHLSVKFPLYNRTKHSLQMSRAWYIENKIQLKLISILYDSI
jgi:hypothetical protein